MTEIEKIDSLFAATFKLPPQQCYLLRLLMQHPVVTSGMIEHKLGIEYGGRMPLYRLRRRVFKYGIVIQSQYGGNYWLEPETKQRVKEIVHDFI
jgi:hypothetical protein